jgi:hypothetical protein
MATIPSSSKRLRPYPKRSAWSGICARTPRSILPLSTKPRAIYKWRYPASRPTRRRHLRSPAASLVTGHRLVRRPLLQFRYASSLQHGAGDGEEHVGSIQWLGAVNLHPLTAKPNKTADSADTRGYQTTLIGFFMPHRLHRLRLLDRFFGANCIRFYPCYPCYPRLFFGF